MLIISMYITHTHTQRLLNFFLAVRYNIAPFIPNSLNNPQNNFVYLTIYVQFFFCFNIEWNIVLRFTHINNVLVYESILLHMRVYLYKLI